MGTLYDQDFYKWTQESARLLREGRFSDLDIENLVEEVESMGRSEKREFISRLAVLIAHLLKWGYQPGKRSRSWASTIVEQRSEVADVLEDNPSFKSTLDDMILRAYKKAVIKVESETGLDEKAFPEACPYSFEQIMDRKFLPGPLLEQ